MTEQASLENPDVARARALHQAGRHAEALAEIEALLRSRPDEAEALVLRGDILVDTGRLEEAVGSYDRALAIAPDHPHAHDYRGIALAQMGRLEDAGESFARAVAIDPDNANALNNLSLLLTMQGRGEEALAQLDRAIALRPDFVVAHNSRGNALVALGRDEEADRAYGEALRLSPGFLEAQVARAACRRRLGRGEEALADVRAVVERHANDLQALAQLGLKLQQQPDHEGALIVYARIAALQPHNADAHFMCAMMCEALRRPVDSQRHYEQALSVDPQALGALNNLAALLAGTARPVEALPYYDRAIAVDPRNALLYFNRALARKDAQDWAGSVADFDQVLAIDPDFANARGMRLFVARHLCDWADHDRWRDGLEADLRAGKPVSGAFPLLSLFDDTALIRDASRAYVQREFGPVAPRIPAGARADARIHVAYVSGDFREHPLMHLVGDLFAAHDRGKLMVSAYSYGLDTGDPWRRRAEATVDHFVDVHDLAPDRIAARMREAGVDIAVDLTGLTQGGRAHIFAARTAPVQVSWLGHVGTLGAELYDYILSDHYTIPPEEAPHYGEAPAWLPGCYQANARDREVSAAVLTRAQLGLPESGFVYCCFNQSFKISPGMFAAWMRILQAAPGSVLWLWADHPGAQANLRREAAAAGVDPRRLVFAERVAIDLHLARLRLADLFLDTMPYNAGTTASDALRMGVPVLTLSGRTMSARMAGSIVRTVGLPDLVTTSLADYEAKAIALGTDPGAATALKARLAALLPGNPLFDSDRLARDLERLYAEMVARAERGEAPAALGLG